MILKQTLRIFTQLLVGSELRHWLDNRKKDRFAPRFVQPGFDLTIDAFPRSANTWIYYHAQLAYPEAKIGHHVHSWQHFFFSKLFGIPAIMIVRKPDASVQSLVTKKGGSLALGYLDFIITNGIGGLFVDKVHFFDELIGDRGMEALLADISKRLGTKPQSVPVDEVRQLMVTRTAHKNITTPKLRDEDLGAFDRLMQKAANRLYARIEKRWRA
ncbi:hypothetical protein [Qipengyuania sp. 902]|uniref:hypothetical protein n=1 Tax=Qipengyuania sp. 902 TaxID=3417565 RepID=UPI003EBCD3D0